MATYYNIQSQLTDEGGGVPLVTDIYGGGNSPIKSGTHLVTNTPNGNDSQRWELVLDGASGDHFIQSKLKDLDGDHLVIDIEGGNKPVERNANLNAYKKKSSNYDNQLWKFVEQQPGWSVIQSKIKDKEKKLLVVDIRGGSDKDGTHLDAFTLTGNSNQLWQLAG